jgi:putative DNA primase/helicase
MIADQAKPQTAPSLSAKSTEYEQATAFAGTLPPVRTVGNQWYLYTDGLWRPTPRDELKPRLLAILPDQIKTARRINMVLDNLEAQKQVSRSALRGFHFFDDSGAVIINMANGALRVTSSSMSLGAHAEDHSFTFQAVSSYNPNAKCPKFLDTLSQILPDEEDRTLLQVAAGNVLFPSSQHEASLICYGAAGTGKSTIALAIAAALGPDLVQHLTLSQLCDPRSYSLPKLWYAALNLGTEINTLALDDSTNFKQLVSGEPVEARPIYGTPFTMTTTCKLWFLANNPPLFKYGTEAEHRRMRFLQFNIVPPAKDTTLKAKLINERNGIFLWALHGLQTLMRSGTVPLGGPNSRNVHSTFAVTNDPIGAFIDSCCVLDPGTSIVKADLATAYADFIAQHGLPSQSTEWFFKRLYEKHTSVVPAKRQHTPVVCGIALK